ncbi:response regulator [Glaciimonas soli]|nr:response regulator [Glaciimonas soli]
MRQIILADHHPIIVAGVRSYIERSPGFNITATVATTDQLVARLTDTQCDILIMDFSMPISRICDGLTLLSYVKRHYPALWVIVFTMNAMPAVLYQIIKGGVNGLLHVSDEMAELGHAIQGEGQNAHYIGTSIRNMLRAGPLVKMPTPRETEVLRLYVEGLTLHEIAKRLNKSVKTVGLQKTSAMKKMGLQNDIELGRYARGIDAPLGEHFVAVPEPKMLTLSVLAHATGSS